MLLTLRASQTPATDFAAFLGLPLDRIASFELPFGRAHAFLPEATETEATVALLLDVDPVASTPVDERLYTASPLLAAAVARTFAPILEGPEQPSIPLEARLAAFPCKGGEARLRSAFEPLGYAVTAEALPLDPTFPEWGTSRCFSVTLRATLPVRELLGHLCSLLPILAGDDDPANP
ncbi:MAG TPA: hypothetical protein VKK31_01490 [Thermoanaerobaculia bacterium]|nr:hypothetical protein [Thermoanaerobaculia bacterium]